MAVGVQTAPGATPVTLEKTKSKGLWAEAFARLIRNRMAVIGLCIIALLVFFALFANVIAPKGYADQILTDNNVVPVWLPWIFPSVKAGRDVNGQPIYLKDQDGNQILDSKTQKPIIAGYAKLTSKYLLGADSLGRDIFSRLVYGTRISLAVAFVGPLMALIIGMALGSISGFYGGWIDNLLMRIVDLMYAFPSILLIILMMAFFRTSLNSVDPNSFAGALGKLDAAFGGLLFIFIGIGITSWEGMARLVRGQVLAVREREYVVAAQSIGMNRRSVLVRHVLPNILGPVIVAETLNIPNYIATEAFLSFIGLGVNPPTPSWGSMISDGSRGIRTYPNQAIFPALTLALAMFAFNFLGDGLRDALDPRMRGVD